jgi:hypothetical protein
MITALLWANVAACGTDNNPPPPVATSTTSSALSPPPDDQFVFQQRLAEDRKDLFPVRIYESIPRTVRVGDEFELHALLCGPRSQCPDSAPTGSPGSPGPAPTSPDLGGAIVSADLVTNEQAVHVQLFSARRQPLIDRTDRAEWGWLLVANVPGSYLIHTYFTAYQADTDVPLTSSTVVTQTVEVVPAGHPDTGPTPPSAASAPPGGSGPVDVLVVIATLIGGVVAAIALFGSITNGVRRVRRRR